MWHPHARKSFETFEIPSRVLIIETGPLAGNLDPRYVYRALSCPDTSSRRLLASEAFEIAAESVDSGSGRFNTVAVDRPQRLSNPHCVARS
ncbi:hypothetical protein SCOCK_250057 [Actinacidiphila cocklensis]|uniref:Uncharacterized protein n=1 Tax=Actinacidiphila cocklensis TaxID=887465 RepID=A0A9W4DQG4_9ACTN|nr:hypothetical protein SCOCK_250057 [Actinacidiphila cocklensis]